MTIYEGESLSVVRRWWTDNRISVVALTINEGKQTNDNREPETYAGAYSTDDSPKNTYASIGYGNHHREIFQSYIIQTHLYIYGATHRSCDLRTPAISYRPVKVKLARANSPWNKKNGMARLSNTSTGFTAVSCPICSRVSRAVLDFSDELIIQS